MSNDETPPPPPPMEEEEEEEEPTPICFQKQTKQPKTDAVVPSLPAPMHQITGHKHSKSSKHAPRV